MREKALDLEIKLIASDMDDTLLNDEHKVSLRNREAINKAIAAGKIFILATGRMYISAKLFADRLGLQVPLVTYNGGLVKHSQSGEVLYEKKLKLETAAELLAYCKTKGYYVQVYQDSEMYIKEHNDFSRKYAEIAEITPIAIGEELYNIQSAPNKLLVMTTTAEFKAAWEDFATTFKGKIDVTSSKDNFLELMEPGVNKWEAVKAVANLYGIKPTEIMCIGDSNNDLQMIGNAAIGVAVGNASSKVMQAAKLVTATNNEDGVALAIESVLAEQINVED